MSSWGRYADQYHTLPEYVSQHLEHYVGLSRAGNFDEAGRLFSQTLSRDVDNPSVFFEHADALLNQGRFGTLNNFLVTSAPHFEPDTDQQQLLMLMKHLANIYVSGALLPALKAARDIKNSIYSQKQWEQSSTYQLHSVELYIRIIKYTFSHSNWAGEEDQQIPGTTFSDNSAPVLPWAASALWLEGLIHRQLWLPAKIFTKVVASVVPEKLGLALYTRLLDSMPDLKFCHPSTEFAYIATCTAFSQYPSWQKMYSEARNAARSAERLLAAAQAKDNGCFPRERIEYEFVLQSLETGQHMHQAQHLSRAAAIATKHRDLVSESRALSAMLDIPQIAADRARAVEISARLDQIEGDLQPDLPSVLYEKQRLLGLTGHDDLGKLAEWFTRFEIRYPTSNMIHTPDISEVPLDSDAFDNPQALYYKASALSRIYMVLGNKPREDHVRDEMDSLEAHLPGRARAAFAAESFASEWFGNTARVFNPNTGMRVLLRRISSAWERGTLSLDELKEIVPDARIVSEDNEKNYSPNLVDTTSLRRKLFGPPLRQEVWQRKLHTIVGWLKRDTLWSAASSDLLVGTLLYYRQLHHIDVEEGSQAYIKDQKQSLDAFSDSWPTFDQEVKDMFRLI